MENNYNIDYDYGNNLIVEFLDWYVPDKRCKDGKRLEIPENLTSIIDMDFDKQGEPYLIYDINLKFHTSWDWLMIAVKKIWSIVQNRESLFYFDLNHLGIDEVVFGNGNPYDHMNACYSAVINFIEWNNINMNKIKSQIITI